MIRSIGNCKDGVTTSYFGDVRLLKNIRDKDRSLGDGGKGKDGVMKVAIIIIAALGIFDVLLIFGSLKLERMREVRENRDEQMD